MPANHWEICRFLKLVKEVKGVSFLVVGRGVDLFGISDKAPEHVDLFNIGALSLTSHPHALTLFNDRGKLNYNCS